MNIVLVDARVRQFVEQTSFALLACTLPPSSEMKKHGQQGIQSVVSASHEPLSSVGECFKLKKKPNKWSGGILYSENMAKSKGAGISLAEIGRKKLTCSPSCFW